MGRKSTKLDIGPVQFLFSLARAKNTVKSFNSHKFATQLQRAANKRVIDIIRTHPESNRKHVIERTAARMWLCLVRHSKVYRSYLESRTCGLTGAEPPLLA
jgi:hypothetical protein